MIRTLALTPRIATGGRAVLPKGRDSVPAVWALVALPVLAAGIALADDRVGFKLFMAGLAIATLLLVIGLLLWVRALSAGRIRISAAGPLRFMPPNYLRAASLVVPLGLLMPGIIAFTVARLDLPTMQGSTRFLTVGPYAMAAIAAFILLRMAWGIQTSLGLTLDAEGLRGIRGVRKVNLAWDELANASPLGPHGPKLLLIRHEGRPVVIDAHHLGSDPAIVAAVIQHYLHHPAQRELLEDGTSALHAVEHADSRPQPGTSSRNSA